MKNLNTATTLNPDMHKKGFVPEGICAPELWEEYQEDPFAFGIKYSEVGGGSTFETECVKNANNYLKEISRLKNTPFNILIKDVHSRLSIIIRNNKKADHCSRNEKRYIIIGETVEDDIKREAHYLEEIELATEMMDKLKLVDKKFELKPFIAFLNQYRSFEAK